MKPNRGLIVAVLWAVVIACGLQGFHVLSPSAPLLANLYATLQLFSLNGSFGNQKLPLALEIARFAAPALTLYTAALAFADGSVQAARRLKARFLWRNHIVVCGLGSEGMAITSSLVADGEKVVVLDPAPPADHMQSVAATPRAVIIRANATDLNALRKAGLKRARHILIFCGTDAQNIDVWNHLRSLKNLNDLSIRVHITDTYLANRLELVNSIHPSLRIVNTHHIAVRQLFQAYPLDRLYNTHSKEAPHVVLVGFGEMGQHVLLEAIRLYSSESPGPLRVTIVDRMASQAWASFVAHRPNVEQLCIAFLVEPPVGNRHTVAGLVAAAGPVSAWYVCLRDDNETLREAFDLHQSCIQTVTANAPIFVRLRTSPGFEQMIDQHGGQLKLLNGILPFGAFREVLTAQVLLAESLDKLACCFHEHYLASLDEVNPFHPVQQPWSRLSDTYRRSNIHAADHLAVKLRALGIRLERRGDEQTTTVFTQDEIKELARKEHVRWCTERALDGWAHAPNRVDALKLHPNLKPWIDLDPQVQSHNIQQAKNIAAIASEGGWVLKRDLVVGVTGHRSYSDPDNVRALISAELKKITTANPQRKLVILSALAAGADQDVARIALDEFGAELWAVAPFPLELYQSDFDDPSRSDLYTLLDRASRYDEMPQRFGSIVETAVRGSVRDRQYALAGAYVMQNSEHLIAVWDGREARGTGGTGEVISWVHQRRVPEPYVFERSSRSFPELHLVGVRRT